MRFIKDNLLRSEFVVFYLYLLIAMQQRQGDELCVN